MAIAAAGCGGKPDQPFDLAAAPPAPDYRQASAWLAFPGRDGLERSAPAGLSAISEAEAPADVFFVHPTTTAERDAWNVALDGETPLADAVLLSQVSAFNGCCRLYAPRYRQASLAGLEEPSAKDLAYGDVVAAFRRFQELNGDRPFMIAGHSQGVGHASRLLQQEVLGQPPQARMVAAYLIGGYAPANFAEAGLPVCDAPRQTGCVISWNAGKIGAALARIVIDDKTYWWRGGWKSEDQAPALCVNPLTWRAGDTETPAPASANPGSMPFPEARDTDRAEILPALDAQLTGARCNRGMLEVELPSTAGTGYGDQLTRLAGSYHLQDYGLFYAAVRANAVERVAAWRALQGR